MRLLRKGIVCRSFPAVSGLSMRHRAACWLFDPSTRCQTRGFDSKGLIDDASVGMVGQAGIEPATHWIPAAVHRRRAQLLCHLSYRPIECPAELHRANEYQRTTIRYRGAASYGLRLMNWKGGRSLANDQGGGRSRIRTGNLLLCCRRTSEILLARIARDCYRALYFCRSLTRNRRIHSSCADSLQPSSSQLPQPSHQSAYRSPLGFR